MFGGILFKYVVFEDGCEVSAESAGLVNLLFLSAPVRVGLFNGMFGEKFGG